MTKKQLQTISKLFSYRLILDYEGVTYPMDIVYVNERSVFLKTYQKFVKYFSDRLSGVLLNTKDAFIKPVSGVIRGFRPLAKIGEDLDFNAEEWLIEVEIENNHQIPPEWISFSRSEDQNLNQPPHPYEELESS